MRHKRNKAWRPSGFRRFIGNLFIILVLAFTIYLALVMVHRIRTVAFPQAYRSTLRDEMILCGIMFLCALDVRFRLFTRLRPAWTKVVGWILRAAVVLVTLAVLETTADVVAQGMINDAGDADNVLVLGMALEDGQPTKDLKLRVETARKYAEAHPNATLVLTGGNPDESGRTEAAVMRDLLAEQGFSGDRIVLEDQARDTRTNFKNAAQLMDPSQPVAVVSSNYHMSRAVPIAETAGFTQVTRLPAPSDPLYYGANVMWEVMMKINSVLPRGRGR